MRVSRPSAGSAFALAVLLASCAAPPPKQPLAPGYYIFDARRLGITRRIIVTPGRRRLAYDVWRVSRSGDGTAKHAHYDLIAADDVPSSGDFSVTQDGSDCGTLRIEPYRAANGTGIDGILTVKYGLATEHFLAMPSGDAVRYREYDDAVTRGIAQAAADKPRLYDALSFFAKVYYSELNPSCTYD